MGDPSFHKLSLLMQLLSLGIHFTHSALFFQSPSAFSPQSLSTCRECPLYTYGSIQLSNTTQLFFITIYNTVYKLLKFFALHSIFFSFFFFLNFQLLWTNFFIQLFPGELPFILLEYRVLQSRGLVFFRDISFLQHQCLDLVDTQ